MNRLVFSQEFDKSFSKQKDPGVRRQIWNKILQLEDRAPLGKKLKGNPFWSIHVGDYRIIYEMRQDEIVIALILSRKHDYREL